MGGGSDGGGSDGWSSMGGGAGGGKGEPDLSSLAAPSGFRQLESAPRIPLGAGSSASGFPGGSRVGSGGGGGSPSLPSTPRSHVSSPPPNQKRSSRMSGVSRSHTGSRAPSVVALPRTFGNGHVFGSPGAAVADPDSVAAGLKGLSNWAPLAFSASFEPGADGAPAPIELEDRRVLTELSRNMVEQLNSMFAFMHQVVVKERVRHASSVSMMMRKVDRDLKDTYDSVKEIFGSLTQQLVGLVKEVENSREQVRAIQEKYTAARQSAEAQAQYVLELEAVLDGQCEGVSETLKKLTEQSVGKSKALGKQAEDAKNKEANMKAENERLKRELQKAKDTADRILGGHEPPALPEMSASWTRRVTGASSRGSSSSYWESDYGGDRAGAGFFDPVQEEPGGVDIVGSVLAHCDSARAVPRTKPVRTPRRPHHAHAHGGGPGSGGASEREVARLRRSLEEAEARGERLHSLVGFSSASMVLLRDVVGLLRSSGHLAVADVTGKLPKAASPSQNATEVLDQIVNLFHSHAPKLKGLPEVLQALSREVERGPPRKSQEVDHGGCIS